MQSRRGGISASNMAAAKGGNVAVSVSASKQPAAAVSLGTRPHLLDARGRDVTPRPLVPTKSEADPNRAPLQRQSLLESSVAPNTDVNVSDGLGGNGFTRSQVDDDSVLDDGAEDGSARGGGKLNMGVGDGLNTPALPERRGVPIVRGPLASTTRLQHEGVAGRSQRRTLGPSTLILSETDTVIQFEMASSRVLQDTAEAKKVTARNAEYEKLKVAMASAGASELYPSRGTEVLSAPRRNKEVQVEPVHCSSVETQAMPYDIWDAAHAPENTSFDSLQVPTLKGPGTTTTGMLERAVRESVKACLDTPGCFLDAEGEVRILPGSHVTSVGPGGSPVGAYGSVGASRLRGTRGSVSTGVSGPGDRGRGALASSSASGAPPVARDPRYAVTSVSPPGRAGPVGFGAASGATASTTGGAAAAASSSPAASPTRRAAAGTGAGPGRGGSVGGAAAEHASPGPGSSSLADRLRKAALGAVAVAAMNSAFSHHKDSAAAAQARRGAAVQSLLEDASALDSGDKDGAIDTSRTCSDDSASVGESVSMGASRVVGAGEGAGAGGQAAAAAAGYGQGSPGGGGANASLLPAGAAGGTLDLTPLQAEQAARVLASPSLLASLRVAERAVLQNVTHGVQRRYLGRPTMGSSDELYRAGVLQGVAGAVSASDRQAAEQAAAAGRLMLLRTNRGEGEREEDEEEDEEEGEGFNNASVLLHHASEGRAAADDVTAFGALTLRPGSSAAPLASTTLGSGRRGSCEAGAGAAPVASSGTGSLAMAPSNPLEFMGALDSGASPSKAAPPRPGLKRMWSYWWSDIDGFSVSGMSWNAAAGGVLLAVGYRRSEPANRASAAAITAATEAAAAAAAATSASPFAQQQPRATVPSRSLSPSSKRRASSSPTAPGPHSGDSFATGGGGRNSAGGGARFPGDAACGAIALWSARNVAFPSARLISPRGVGVTAVAFSRLHPSLLAAGLEDGTVCIYDTRVALASGSPCRPILVSRSLGSGAHLGPVWQVGWVSKADAGTEVLVSVSSDGRVTEWNVKKGLVPSPLMMLKRSDKGSASSAVSAKKRSNGVPSSVESDALTAGAGTPSADGSDTPSSRGGGATGKTAPGALPPLKRVPESGGSAAALGAPGSDGLLSRSVGGLCFDFGPLDCTSYLVGTDDGRVQRCSTTYTEQCLETLHAHEGAVNKLALSPFLPCALLTASSDWTVRLWNLLLPPTAPPVVFATDSVRDAVVDVCWSPSIPTLFACVSNDGRVMLWDVTSLVPLVDEVARLDETTWRAQLAEKQVEEVRVATAAAQRRRAIERLDDSDDELGPGEDASPGAPVHPGERRYSSGVAAPTDPASTGPLGRRGSLLPPLGGGGSADSAGSTGQQQRRASSAATEAGAAAATAAAPALLPPPKALTCVLFGASGTHVLVTGDVTGRVDVYCLTNMDALLKLQDSSGNGSSSAAFRNSGMPIRAPRFQDLVGGEGALDEGTAAALLAESARRALAGAPPVLVAATEGELDSEQYTERVGGLMSALEAMRPKQA